MPQIVKPGNYFLSQSSTIDYYPFGQEMPGRVNYASSYRMGFNGQWKDSEFSGTDGGHYEFKFREYDSRIGRFWQVDPLFKDYPWNSTYAFAENDVIRAIDLEGKEKLVKTQGAPGNNDPLHFEHAKDGTSFNFCPLIIPVASFQIEEAVLKAAPSNYERWVNAQNDPVSEYVKRDVVLQASAATLLTGGLISTGASSIGTLSNLSLKAYTCLNTTNLSVQAYYYLNTTTTGAAVQFGLGALYAGLKEAKKTSPDMPDCDFLPVLNYGDKLTTFGITAFKLWNGPQNTSNSISTPVTSSTSSINTTGSTRGPATNNMTSPVNENSNNSGTNINGYDFSGSSGTATPPMTISYKVKKF